MIVKRDFIYSPKGKNRPLHIYLPEEYEKSEESYPVMYFFDGHNLFSDEDATYGKSWGLQSFLDAWDQPMIIVGAECGHEGDERLSEYLPYPAESGYFKQFQVMGDQTLRWIVDEIKPMIDKEYRTKPWRGCTGIGGSSMGGLMALYGAVHYNEWFSKAACLSSSIGICMKPLMEDMNRQRMDPDTRVYLSWGTKEVRGLKNTKVEDRRSLTYRRNRQAAEKIEESGAKAKLYCQVGGRHCEADWEKQIPEFMNFLWKE